jgi:hypothetical protein
MVGERPTSNLRLRSPPLAKGGLGGFSGGSLPNPPSPSLWKGGKSVLFERLGGAPSKAEKKEGRSAGDRPQRLNGGSDETRTRDLRRDRPAF